MRRRIFAVALLVLGGLAIFVGYPRWREHQRLEDEACARAILAQIGRAQAVFWEQEGRYSARLDDLAAIVAPAAAVGKKGVVPIPADGEGCGHRFEVGVEAQGQRFWARATPLDDPTLRSHWLLDADGIHAGQGQPATADDPVVPEEPGP